MFRLIASALVLVLLVSAPVEAGKPKGRATVDCGVSIRWTGVRAVQPENLIGWVVYRPDGSTFDAGQTDVEPDGSAGVDISPANVAGTWRLVWDNEWPIDRSHRTVEFECQFCADDD